MRLFWIVFGAVVAAIAVTAAAPLVVNDLGRHFRERSAERRAKEEMEACLNTETWPDKRTACVARYGEVLRSLKRTD